jgi:Ca2+-binding EF-hand superfamily protein
MGNKHPQEPLTPQLKRQVEDTFTQLDLQPHHKLNKNDLLAYFKVSGGFSRVPMTEWQILKDANPKSSCLELGEFVIFWEIAKAADHSEEEIRMELKRIEYGQSWPGFA